MHEAAVEPGLHVEVVKGPLEVIPVQMSVDPKHLLVDIAAVLEEVVGEANRLANPITPAERRDGRVETGRSHGDWSSGARGIDATRRVRGGRGWVRSAFNGEESVVHELAADPLLHQLNVPVGCQTSGLTDIIQPGVSMTVRPGSANVPMERSGSYSPSSRHRGAGHLVADGKLAGVGALDHLDKFREGSVLLNHLNPVGQYHSNKKRPVTEKP